jgi:hypothetical protein
MNKYLIRFVLERYYLVDHHDQDSHESCKDHGEGHVGTVVELGKPASSICISMHWMRVRVKIFITLEAQ